MKALLITLGMAATMLAAVAPADAQRYHGRPGYHGRHHRHHPHHGHGHRHPPRRHHR